MTQISISFIQGLIRDIIKQFYIDNSTITYKNENLEDKTFAISQPDIYDYYDDTIDDQICISNIKIENTHILSNTSKKEDYNIDIIFVKPSETSANQFLYELKALYDLFDRKGTYSYTSTTHTQKFIVDELKVISSYFVEKIKNPRGQNSLNEFWLAYFPIYICGKYVTE